METKLITLLTCLCFISCSQRNINYIDNINNKEAYKNSEKLSDPFIGKKDSTFTNIISDGAYYKFYFLTDNTYKIIWGNRNFKSVTTAQFETYGNGNLSLIDFNKEYIILGQSTGTNANIRVLLPLKRGKSNKVFENVLYENLRKSILLKDNNDSHNLVLLNFKNNRSKLIEVGNLCPAIDYTSCIDSVSVIESKLHIYYQGSNWSTNKNDNQVLKVNIW